MEQLIMWNISKISIKGLELKFNYLNTLNGYNQAIINLEYLIGQ